MTLSMTSGNEEQIVISNILNFIYVLFENRKLENNKKNINLEKKNI